MLAGLLRRVLGDSAVDTEQKAASSNVKLEARRQERKSVTWQVKHQREVLPLYVAAR